MEKDENLERNLKYNLVQLPAFIKGEPDGGGVLSDGIKVMQLGPCSAHLTLQTFLKKSAAVLHVLLYSGASHIDLTTCRQLRQARKAHRLKIRF